MSKERLEAIRHYYREIESFDPGTQSDINWLIEQAEKREYWMKQHRKRANELEDAYFKIQLIENQNKRYREALEEIARGRFPGASYKARKALEGKE